MLWVIRIELIVHVIRLLRLILYAIFSLDFDCSDQFMVLQIVLSSEIKTSITDLRRNAINELIMVYKRWRVTRG